MIELILKTFFDEHLDVPSFFEHVEDLPDEYILIERTSGSRKNMLNSATIAIQSYSTSLQKAMELNAKVKETMEKLDEHDAVSGIHLNADYNYTDTETKQYRYQAVFDINYY